MAWIIVAGVSCRVMRPRSTWRCSDKRATCHDLGPEFGDVIVAKPAVEGVEQQHVLAIEAVVLEGPDRRPGFAFQRVGIPQRVGQAVHAERVVGRFGREQLRIEPPGR